MLVAKTIRTCQSKFMMLLHALAVRPRCYSVRLYYHLDAKYRYTQDNDAQVNLFSLKVGSQMHCVNFPYLAAVLAEKGEEHKRQLWSLGFAIAALVLSVASIIAQVITAK